ncbi:P-loop containing nucleoside triphosphate hydrolases superfamily protein [Euphorbia peplus]|nr:P-loop containing nucleoside triphosphate hydrolases superfamily protein [Euphorbia peplus]
MLFRSLAQGIIPNEFYNKNIWKIFSQFSNQLTMLIHEYDSLVRNEIYQAAEVYLSSKLDASTDQTFSVSKLETEKQLKLKMERNQEIVDIFNNVKFKWVFERSQTKSQVEMYEEDDRPMNRIEKSEV